MAELDVMNRNKEMPAGCSGHEQDARASEGLLDEWNNSMRFEATIEVPAGQTLNIGKVAPQTGSNGLQTLAGGVDQILLPQNWNYQNWVTKVVDKATNTEYTFSQFQTEFPNIITP